MPDDRQRQEVPVGRRCAKPSGSSTQNARSVDPRRCSQGRLIAILLTGHDCPVAERLIRRVQRPKHMLGDKADDSAEWREELDEHGTKSVIPNRSNRKQPSCFIASRE
jgi:hypothetical protein